MNSRLIKEVAHSYFPIALRAYNEWAGRHYKAKPVADIFRDIYQHNDFRGETSVSGPGSESVQTEKLRQELPQLLRRHNIFRLMDAPCGDLNWMPDVLERCPLEYTGADIVPDLIFGHEMRFRGRGLRFIRADITEDPLPVADTILCRDCLVHLSNELVLAALRNFQRSGTRLLLTTHFPATRANVDIVPGMWRAVNLQLAPFFLPPPLEMILEECTENDGTVADKTLALFDLSAWSAPAQANND